MSKKYEVKYKDKVSKFKLFVPIEFIEDSSISPLAFRLILYIYSKRAIKHFIIRKSVIRKLLGPKKDFRSNYKSCMIELQNLGYVYKKSPTSTSFIYRKLNDDFTPIVDCNDKKLDGHCVQLDTQNTQKLDGRRAQELDGHCVYIDIKSPLKGDFKKRIKSSLQDLIDRKKVLSKNSLKPLSACPLGAASGHNLAKGKERSDQGVRGHILGAKVIPPASNVKLSTPVPQKSNLKALQAHISRTEYNESSETKKDPTEALNARKIMEDLLEELKPLSRT